MTTATKPETIPAEFPLTRGTPIFANGYEGAYIREYIAPEGESKGMHEVRLPGGECCLCGSEIEVIPPRDKMELINKIRRNGDFFGPGDLELMIEFRPETLILARCNATRFVAAARDMPRMLEIIELADAKETESGKPVGEWVRDLSLPTELKTL